MSTVIIVHGWAGNSESGWLPWLSEELRNRNVEVITPDMPDTNTPRIESWVPFLAGLVKEANENLYFVGHSMGCLTIMRYLQNLPENDKVGGVVFVAGFSKTLTGLSDAEVLVAKPWLETPVDWAHVVSHCSSFVDIYSDDDPFVPVSEAQILKDKLNAKLVLDSGRGHFTDEDDVTQLPVVLNELLVVMGLPVDTTLI